MSVYSKLLWQGAGTNGLLVIYTTPITMTAVLRDLEVYNGTGATININLAQSAPGFGNSLVCTVNNVPAGHGGQWQGRVVLPSGGQLSLGAYGPDVFFALSGYELSP